MRGVFSVIAYCRAFSLFLAFSVLYTNVWRPTVQLSSITNQTENNTTTRCCDSTRHVLLVSGFSNSGILCLEISRHVPLALVDGVGLLERVGVGLGALCDQRRRVCYTIPVTAPPALSITSLSPAPTRHSMHSGAWRTSIGERLDGLCRNHGHFLCAHRHAIQQSFDHLLRRSVRAQKVFLPTRRGRSVEKEADACVA